MYRPILVLKSVIFGLFIAFFLAFSALLQSAKVGEPRGSPGRVNVIYQRALVDFEDLREESVPNWEECPRWFQLTTAFKKCLLHKLHSVNPERVWMELYMMADLCGASLLKHVLRSKYLLNSDDLKLLILPENPEVQSSVVTVGIGNDTAAERRLRIYIPNTSFYGADPIPESGEVYRRIGQLHQIAVAGQNGDLNASVLVDGVYSWQTVKAVTLDKFILEYLKLPQVDFLFLDSEGAEYQILSQLTEGGPLARAGVPICQINMELHGPLEQYGMNRASFGRKVKKFLDESAYIPIWIPMPLRHQRMFLIDWKSSYCINKFYKHWC